MSQQQHLLVTGGAGFIGSHLVERLISDGHRVTVIDDCSTGSEENLRSVFGNPNLTMLRTKVSECPDLDWLMADCSMAYHLAAAVGVELVVHSPVHTIETNLHETEVVLAAAARHRTPVLITSTSEVYGKSQKESFSEEDDLIIGPPHLGRWSYACSKLMDEFLALAYRREKSLSVIVARLFNTVGPRQTGRYGMVLPRFITAAKNREPLRVYGDGSQSRCFCFVKDTVEALVRLTRTPAAWGEIFNIGSTEEISIEELARRVIGKMDAASRIERVSYDEAYAPGFQDMRRRKPCVMKLKAAIDYVPNTSLDTILDEMIAGIQR